MKRVLPIGMMVLVALFIMSSASAQVNPTAAEIATEISFLPSGVTPAPLPPTDSRGILWDNGPFVTHPGGGPGGSDYSQLENPPNTTLGFGVQVSANNRLADDFDVPPSGWDIDSIIVFAYQTGSTTTSTITAVNMRIWDGEPGTAGATVIWGDETTNIMTDTYWSNCYRGSDLMATNRPIMRNACTTTGLSLSEGTYWADWQIDGTGSSGPWGPPITIPGQYETGNAVQYTSSSGNWNPAQDGGSGFQQGMPFEIWGPPPPAPQIDWNPLEFIVALQIDETYVEILTIYNLGDADLDFNTDIVYTDAPMWLSVTPTSGTVAPNDSIKLDVTFNSAGLPNDTYTADILIASNDPVTPVVEVPATLDVITGVPEASNSGILISYNNGQLIITSPSPVQDIRIYNQLGQVVEQTNATRVITASYKSGIYFIRVSALTGEVVKKVFID
ncbi:MAG: T9SS type A sorting domain-containing protein [Bacteroidales bacterium]|nr:T9SS type A sorting domain-containing protein [Bacteroidales bacterium]